MNSIYKIPPHPAPKSNIQLATAVTAAATGTTSAASARAAKTASARTAETAAAAAAKTAAEEAAARRTGRAGRPRGCLLYTSQLERDNAELTAGKAELDRVRDLFNATDGKRTEAQRQLQAQAEQKMCIRDSSSAVRSVSRRAC